MFKESKDTHDIFSTKFYQEQLPTQTKLGYFDPLVIIRILPPPSISTLYILQYTECWDALVCFWRMVFSPLLKCYSSGKREMRTKYWNNQRWRGIETSRKWEKIPIFIRWAWSLNKVQDKGNRNRRTMNAAGWEILWYYSEILMFMVSWELTISPQVSGIINTRVWRGRDINEELYFFARWQFCLMS